METFVLLLMTGFLIKHFICDFPIRIQTPWMFLNKGTYGHPGGIAHASVHVLASFLLLAVMEVLFAAPAFHSTATALGVLCFEGLVHYHMDWFKMWWCKRKGYKPDTHPQWWNWLGIDQLVHGLTYVVMVAVWVS